MVACGTFAEFLCDQLAPLGRIMRPMFDKTVVVCDGVMFGIVTENTLPGEFVSSARSADCGALRCGRKETAGTKAKSAQGEDSPAYEAA